MPTKSDVPGSVATAVWDDVRLLVGEIEAHLAGFRQAEIIREGYSVVIAGAPNAGKSSLLNALARRDVAIVTDEPGTTRDLVHVALDLGGLKVIVTDTAGIREAAGKVEAIGIERALDSVRRADLVLLLEDMAAPAGLMAPATDAPVLKIGSKADLVEARAAVGGGYDIAVSARSGAGVDDLLTMIAERAAAAADAHGGIIPARARHVALLRDAARKLDGRWPSDEDGLELRAEELRRAADRSVGLPGRSTSRTCWA